jgi:hypothetical protein
MVRRERQEKLAFARFVAGLVKALPGVSSESVETMLVAYAQQVTHEVYNAAARPKDPNEKENKKLLTKVDQMTVPEDQLPKLPEPPKKRGRRR